MAFDDSKGPFDQDYTCSFYGKKQSQVKKLMTGHKALMREECAAPCNEMLDKELKKPAGEKITDLPKPKESKKILDEYVIGQDDAKVALSVTVYKHNLRMNYEQDHHFVCGIAKIQYPDAGTDRKRENPPCTNPS
jgi:ATP-dependent protease Clp, ATPase subunit